MARFAIICEYNPLHSGHMYHLESARRAGADSIICIMSGNFTQRGEPAVAHKYTRARAALACGADLVVELPFPYACASAEFFASAGVAAADALGADTLYFGSECGDIERLSRAAQLTVSDEFKQAYQDLIKTNIGTAAAYTKAFSAVSSHDFTALSNDLLGLAYCKAIYAGNYDITPFCTTRIGAAYNDDALTDTYPSATALRKLWRENGLFELQKHLPSGSYQALADAHAKGELFKNACAFDAAVLGILRTMPTDRINAAALCGGGLGDRIAEAAHHATNLAELYAACAHKSLPDAHVRRAVLYAAIGVQEADLRRTPAYLCVLGADAKGRRLLSDLRHTCPLPLVTKPADAPDCAQRMLSDRADALYTLALGTPQGSGFFKRQSPIMTD